MTLDFSDSEISNFHIVHDTFKVQINVRVDDDRQYFQSEGPLMHSYM